MARAIIRLFEPIPIKLPNARHYIITRSLYTFYPLLEVEKHFLMFSFFLKILLRSGF